MGKQKATSKKAKSRKKTGPMGANKPYGSKSVAVPGGGNALLQEGLLALKQKHYPQAKALLGKAVEQWPNNTDILTCYLETLQHVGSKSEEMEATRQLLALNPGNVGTALELANLYLQLYQLGRCVRLATRYLKQYPADSRWVVVLAEAYQRADRPHKAEQWLNVYVSSLGPRAKDVVRHTPKIAMLQANIALSTNNLERALQIALDVTIAHPSPATYSQAVNVFVRSGALVQAVRLAKTMVQHFPKDRMLLQFAHDIFRGVADIPGGKPRTVPETFANPKPGTADIVMISPTHFLENGGGHHPPQIARALAGLGHRVLFNQVHAAKTAPAADKEAMVVMGDVYRNLQELPVTAFQRQVWQQYVGQVFSVGDTPEAAPPRPKVVLVMHWSPYILSLLPMFKAQGFTVVYWCVDDWQGLNEVRSPLTVETVCCHVADVLLATAEPLAKKLNTIVGKPVTTVIRNGFSRQHFPKVVAPAPPPADMRFGEKKTIVYWGGLVHHWLDWELMTQLVHRHPDWMFNVIGPNKEGDLTHPAIEALRDAPNVVFLGSKPVSELAAYGHHADAGVIHFKVNDLTEAVNPVKAYEYLACGLPIVSTPMPELDAFPYTWQCQTVEEMEAAFAAIETTPAPTEAIEQFLNTTTWQGRAEAFLQACSLG